MIIEKAKIKGLDSLRFIAFFIVFIGHSTPWLPIGHYGIDLFFVLSSFLLTYLALIEIKVTDKFSKKSFFIRRSLRLYPLYYAFIISCFVLLPLMENILNSQVSLPEKKYLYFLFLSNFDTSDHIFALKFLWTISIEEQFYLLFLFLSLFFRQHIHLPIIFLYLLYFIGTYCGQIFDWNMYTLTTTYFPDFAAGMIAANLYFKKKLPKLKILFVVVVLCLALAVIFQYFAFFQNFTQLPISILMACSILFTARVFDAFSINNILIRITEYLGKYTYGLYVYSGLVLTLSIKFFNWNNIWYKLFFECILLFLVAWVSYNYFEVFFINLKKYFQPISFKKKKQAN